MPRTLELEPAPAVRPAGNSRPSDFDPTIRSEAERGRLLEFWVEAGVVEHRDGEYVIAEWRAIRATVAQAFAT